MPWGVFTATYSPNSGPLRLGNFSCIDADRPSTSLGPQARTYQATFAIGDHLEKATVAASGPVSAFTAMLFDRGIAIDMVRFHQLKSDGHTATFIQGTDGLHTQWAMGWSEDKDDSAIQAIVACANRLMSVAWYVDIDATARKYVWKRR
ncbi:MAG: hypothetical protein QOH60_2021 [Mycobacterium sp.]|nr:hypothetical protein [Mycobacterium sp.]